MERDKRPAYAALLLFATAWFLPVEAGAARISDGILPGYQAFMVAFGPVTLHRFNELDLIIVRELLTAISALSNLLMFYALAVVLGWPRIHFPTPKRLSGSTQPSPGWKPWHRSASPAETTGERAAGSNGP